VVIRRTDRISTVLRDDESLVDVLVSVSPVFERLRNPGLRKVMARLVTVEQAARIAGVDPDELVARLNTRVIGRSESGTDASAGTLAARPAEPPPIPDGAPPALARIPPEAVIRIDVREDLLNGHEPFSRIMAAKRLVPQGGALRLRAIFEPVPLYAVLERQGFAHYTERLADDDWVVWFYPPAHAVSPRGNAASDPAAPAESPPTGVNGDEDAGVVVLDVRGLEPPEPMVRTLEALEALPPGATLVQVNARVPQFLLPRLEERGFTYEIREQGPDLVRVFIRRRESD